MIEEYKFGSISVDGKVYQHDIGINWAGQVFDWPRVKSHIVDIEDIIDALDQGPETIVIGTGEQGINIRKDESIEEEGVQEKVVGLFHLTC